MIDVKENTDGTLTISWDEEGPENEIFKHFKAEDFIKILTDYAKETTGEPQQTNNYQREYIETYYNSESEGKEHNDFDQKYNQYIEDTAKETFGQAYHSPEAQGSWD
jgi:flagellar motor switch protein FliG